MFRILCLVPAFAVLLAGPSSAQVTLKWKLVEGRTSTVETTVDIKQTLTLAGMPLDTKTKQTVIVESATGSRSNDGKLRVKNQIKSIKSNMSMPGGLEMEFDSENPPEETGSPTDLIIKALKASAGLKWVSVFGQDGKVVDVEGTDEYLNSIDVQTQALVADQLDADYLKEKTNDELEVLPPNPIKPGDSWKLTQTVRLGAGQTMTFKTDYKYEGTVDKGGRQMDRVTFKSTDVEYEMKGGGGFGATVEESDMKIESSDGEFFFDRELGVVVEKKDKVRLTGTLKMSVGGQQLEGTLDLTMASLAKASVKTAAAR